MSYKMEGSDVYRDDKLVATLSDDGNVVYMEGAKKYASAIHALIEKNGAKKGGPEAQASPAPDLKPTDPALDDSPATDKELQGVRDPAAAVTPVDPSVSANEIEAAKKVLARAGLQFEGDEEPVTLPPDQIPPPPPLDKRYGDKTPAYRKWKRKYHPGRKVIEKFLSDNAKKGKGLSRKDQGLPEIGDGY